ncbi:TetR/AcrR family transcriptional regulator [Mycobacterium sp.]|jgi:AcrR family transcriptional regulator|uniref:TetR/AcrR family transcriptional regulator n=1 Tax=Mycobacterium sp. TaxID=1785 RepID=UPI002D712591|nr:TetR/AcrR family transcriptional regulator [Mycobacterium sp.]HZA11733.1 TetR/AcrR family transcriptional regulator [Mycobacterium sp.]
MKLRNTTDATDTAPPARDVPTVADALVEAALRAADELAKDVADVPVIVIARHAGISRSTLLRRLGGSRAALDDAVRARGLDPGGAPPVRTRALDAAAALIAESGLAAATLEAIASRADCSVQSLYAIFGTRDGLLRTVFERHGPLLDIEEFVAEDHTDLPAAVRRLYALLADSLSREPRVAPAVFAEAFARPTSPATQTLLSYKGPRMLAVIGQWLTTEIEAGRIRDFPQPLLVEQLLAPMVVHMLLRPTTAALTGIDLPDIGTVCDVFTDAFLGAAGTAGRRRPTRRPGGKRTSAPPANRPQ